MSWKRNLLALVVLVCWDLCVLAQQIGESNAGVSGEARGKKKNKLLVPLIFAAVLMKSIIFPLAFKAMAVMTTVAIGLSGLSLIMSSIVGFKKSIQPETVKIVLKSPHKSYDRQDGYYEETTQLNNEYYT